MSALFKFDTRVAKIPQYLVPKYNHNPNFNWFFVQYKREAHINKGCQSIVDVDASNMLTYKIVTVAMVMVMVACHAYPPGLPYLMGPDDKGFSQFFGVSFLILSGVQSCFDELWNSNGTVV